MDINRKDIIILIKYRLPLQTLIENGVQNELDHLRGEGEADITSVEIVDTIDK